jgi:ubiquinone/menaquinone biosynthesis C-methylase UbiE
MGGEMRTDDASAVERLIARYSARARVYHRLWAPVLATMAVPLLRRLPLAQAACVLDVGTGSGVLAPALRAAAPQAWLLGIDRSEGMLQLARRELSCASMDAQRLALRSQSFDVALLAYVLFHCPEPLAVLREVHRVLRGRGAIGVVTWGSTIVMPGLTIWAEELDAAGAPPAANDASVSQHAAMNTPDKLAAWLVQAGFEAVQSQSDDREFLWPADRLLTVQARCGPPSDRLDGLAPARRAECRRKVRERLRQLDGAQRVCRLQVVSAVARKPT